MEAPLNIIFAGTPEFAAIHLKSLLEADNYGDLYHIVSVYTQPDRPAGRGKKLQESPVKILAVEHNIPVYQPENFKQNDAIIAFQNQKVDLMIVVAYGLLLPVSILDHPTFGCFNVHGSILPRWRGAAPIQRAIWAGDQETGITIMQMDEGLDTGDILKTVALPILATDTSVDLYEKLSQLGPIALLESIKDLSINKLSPIKQEKEFATYAHKLTKVEAQINWSNSAQQIYCAIRAFNPWPISYFQYQEFLIKIWKASILNEDTSEYRGIDKPVGSILNYSKQGIDILTGEGIIRLLEVQLPNKKRMLISDLINARPNWFSPTEQLPIIKSSKE